MSLYSRLWSTHVYLWILCVVCLGGLLSPDLSAEDLRATTSLKYAPADAAFYSAMLRNREQLEIFRASNAYQKLRNLPLVSFGLTMLEGQWQNSDRDEVRVARELWEREENQQLVRVLLDAVSHEIFVYGDANYAEIAKLGQEAQRAMRAAQVRAARNQGKDEDTQQEVVKAVVEKLSGVKAPSTIIGFKISDSPAVEVQITRLEKMLGDVLAKEAELQPLKDRLTRQKIGDASFLTLPLDGSLIPWDQIPDQARDLIDERVRDAIKNMKVTIGLGVKDGYLLLAVGESLDHVKRMGQGKLLIDRPEMNALRKHSDQRIVSIGYASGDLMRQMNSAAGQIDDMVSTAETLLPLAQLDEQNTAALVADVRELAAELKAYIPKPGAIASFTFLNDRGFEGFSYNWGENKSLDGSKKLEILNHVGGDPIAFFAIRGKHTPGAYDWCAKWFGKAWRHAEKNAVPRLADAERQRYEEIRERLLPLIERFDKTTRDNLIPSLQNGEGAFVLDVKAKSKQWHRDLPTTRIPLPMLELASVNLVSDPAALKRATKEYFAIAQKALDIAHELGQDEVPKIELPAPKMEKTDFGEVYVYSIPEALELDAQLAPNAGLSQDVLVLSLTPDMTKRLLKATPVKRVGPLSDVDRPLASASYFNVAGLLEAITPWVNYGVRIAGQAQGDDNPQVRMAAQMVAGNVTPIMDLLKCFGESASVTYIEGDAVVQHSATNFADAK